MTRMQAEGQVGGDASTVSRAQRCPPAPSLETFAARHSERSAAIDAAYATGAYTYREIVERFGIHLATVGRVVRGAVRHKT